MPKTMKLHYMISSSTIQTANETNPIEAGQKKGKCSYGDITCSVQQQPGLG